jgi:hypothetical protein
MAEPGPGRTSEGYDRRLRSYTSAPTKPVLTSSNACHDQLIQDTRASSTLLGCVVEWWCVVEWAFAGVAGAGHDDEYALQFVEYGVEGQSLLAKGFRGLSGLVSGVAGPSEVGVAGGWGSRSESTAGS